MVLRGARRCPSVMWLKRLVAAHCGVVEGRIALIESGSTEYLTDFHLIGEGMDMTCVVSADCTTKPTPRELDLQLRKIMFTHRLDQLSLRQLRGFISENLNIDRNTLEELRPSINDQVFSIIAEWRHQGRLDHYNFDW